MPGFRPEPAFGGVSRVAFAFSRSRSRCPRFFPRPRCSRWCCLGPVASRRVPALSGCRLRCVRGFAVPRSLRSGGLGSLAGRPRCLLAPPAVGLFAAAALGVVRAALRRPSPVPLLVPVLAVPALGRSRCGCASLVAVRSLGSRSALRALVPSSSGPLGWRRRRRRPWPRFRGLSPGR